MRKDFRYLDYTPSTVNANVQYLIFISVRALLPSVCPPCCNYYNIYMVSPLPLSPLIHCHWARWCAGPYQLSAGQGVTSEQLVNCNCLVRCSCSAQDFGIINYLGMRVKPGDICHLTLICHYTFARYKNGCKTLNSRFDRTTYNTSRVRLGSLTRALI